MTHYIISSAGKRSAPRVTRCLFACGLLVFPSAHAADPLPGPIPARVVRVVDGDTLVVRAVIWVGQEVETAIRVEGIDAPEMRGPCSGVGLRAQERLAELAAGAVWLRDVRPDKYGGRMRARVEDAAGTDLGHAMMAAGLARPYDGHRPAGWCPD